MTYFITFLFHSSLVACFFGLNLFHPCHTVNLFVLAYFLLLLLLAVLLPHLSFFFPLLSSYLSVSPFSEAHQGKQMLWLLFMFPLGLPFIQIIHRTCTVQTLGLTGAALAALAASSRHSERTTDTGGGRSGAWGGGLKAYRVNHSNILMGTKTPIRDKA